MQRAFEDDPRVPGRRIWRRGRAASIASGCAAVFIAVVAAGNAVAALSFTLSNASLWFSALECCLAVFMAALAYYCWRDMRGKKGGLIAIEDGVLILDLPADRSLIGRPPAVKTRLRLSEISAVETRLESFRSQFMGNVQRAFRLCLRDGTSIFLFEERALGSMLAEGSLSPVATEIANRANVAVRDLGMVEGKGGILNAWFTSVPTWSTPSLSREEQGARWRRVAWTGTLTTAVFLLIYGLSLLKT